MMELLVSAGHAEYMPSPVEGCGVVEVWSPSRVEAEEGITNLWEMQPAELTALWERLTGEPAEAIPEDADLQWETILRISGAPEAIDLMLDQFSTDNLFTRAPSGDDDLFDYWPSGVRLAQAIARQLDRHFGTTTRRRALEARARDAISNTGFEVELLTKVGLDTHPPRALVDVLRDAEAVILDLFDSYDAAHGHDYAFHDDEADDPATAEHDAAVREVNAEVERVLGGLRQAIEGLERRDG